MVITAQSTKQKPGYKQTEVGMIPEDWEVKRVEEIADKNVQWSIAGGPFGSNLKTVDYVNEGVRIIQLQNIGDGVFHDDYKIYTSEEKADELISCNIYPGEIILSKMGDPVARACIVPNSDRRYLMASDGIRLVVNKKCFDTRFVHDYINSSYFRKKAIEASTGSTRQRIGLEDLKKLPFVAPPLSEQHAIATALSDVDALITSLDRLIAKKRDIKQATMQQLLTGKTRLPGFSGELKQGYKGTEVWIIPADWEVKKLGEVADFLDGRRRPINESDRAKMRGEYPYYGASGVVDYVNDYIFNEELILLGEDGENILSRNCKLACRVSGKIWVNNHAHVLRPKANTDASFLTEYLESLDYEQYNTGTAQPKLNKRVCSEIIVFLPSLTEQRAIATVLSDMDAEITALEQKRDKTRALKQGMMQELLTGKTRLV